jgi:hypothetical protein
VEALGAWNYVGVVTLTLGASIAAAFWRGNFPD